MICISICDALYNYPPYLSLDCICLQEQQDGKKEEKQPTVNDVRLHAVTEEHEPKKDLVTSPTGSPRSSNLLLAAKPKGVKFCHCCALSVR